LKPWDFGFFSIPTPLTQRSEDRTRPNLAGKKDRNKKKKEKKKERKKLNSKG